MTAGRGQFVAANWKMHKNAGEARSYAVELLQSAGRATDREVAIFPPFTALPAVAEVLRDGPIAYGGQNMHWEPSGAFTGEVAAGFLADLGCRYVLVGHSERRSLFGETDEMCRRKVRTAWSAGLVPVLCCGETLGQHDSGQTSTVIDGQLGAALSDDDPGVLVVAYEPVWAIGTGRTATPAQVCDVHGHIRSWLRTHVLSSAAAGTRVIYGGSVNPDNAAGLLAQPEVDGVLVGGASLELGSFLRVAGLAGRAEKDRQAGLDFVSD